ncbi:MAG TPA: sulfurtransferase TusA family protein [Syntrophales bacterium]|nr:sulfurtransferase TusA family protein [Syntrophales bacterium]HOL59311.1 sulfurtransferase TusA family protein [Syntrophales bacterium]HPO35496.1 sulfurtransferase TusA family protein [Syntrophales bacterium]
MGTYRVDARGLSCPQPVVMVDRALKEGKEDLEVLVDNEVSRENVLRLLSKKGLRAEIKEEEGAIVIRVFR